MIVFGILWFLRAFGFCAEALFAQVANTNPRKAPSRNTHIMNHSSVGNMGF